MLPALGLLLSLQLPAASAVAPPAQDVLLFVRENPAPRADVNDGVDLWAIRGDGTRARPLDRRAGWDEAPQWSRDGAWIVYEKAFYDSFDRGEALRSLQVWVVKASGQSRTRLHGAIGWSPSWSPDRTRLAFTSQGIWIRRLGERKARRLTLGADDGEPAWSPDGRTIAFTRPGELWVVPAGGGAPRRLVRRASGGRPAWSPGGRLIAFDGYAAGRESIYVVSPRGGAAKLVAGRYDASPAWSPDGRRIAFARLGTPAQAGIFVTDGPLRRRLTRGLDTQPAWSSDGARIAFRRSRLSDGVADIFVMRADGTGLRNLTRTPNRDERDPAWQPRRRRG